jgi:hypothetical protein
MSKLLTIPEFVENSIATTSSNIQGQENNASLQAQNKLRGALRSRAGYVGQIIEPLARRALPKFEGPVNILPGKWTGLSDTVT